MEPGAWEKAATDRILPDVARASHFGGSAGEVFAAHVDHPAVDLPGKHVIHQAFDDMRQEIADAIANISAD